MKSRFTVPKTIAEHPGVLECESGKDGGSDYKYDILLKPGWAFTYGRMSGCRTGFFHTVAGFLTAEPQRIEKIANE